MNKENSETLQSTAIKRLPYGLVNFGRIRRENFYYIDKTSFIPTLENAGSYLFFIRPRRFGKSLFISMLSAYYDVAYKDQFEELFKGTAIYNNPTREKNSYLILTLNFSQVVSAADKVENSFLRHIRGQAKSFVKKYKKFFGKETEEFIRTIKTIDSPADILSELSRLCRESLVQTYVLIDEYDNFANTILSSSGTGAYNDLTHGESFYRSFFNVLKGGTSEMEAPFNRILLTGVSPITMDDVTSGYNIGDNISMTPSFNRLLGFTRDDVKDILDYYQSANLLHHDTGLLLDIIDRWYGNYLFSDYAPLQESIYNTDMVLFFLKEYFRIDAIPKELIDYNVKIDYNKLRHLILVDKDHTKKANGNFSRLKEIIEQGYTTAKLVKAFPLAELKDTDKFVSLLFYFGLLTIKEPYRNQVRLEIPNETIRRLYYDYIESVYRETGVFALDLAKYEDLMTAFAYDGEWQPLLQFLTGCMKESSGLRDLIEGERMVQAFLNVYLGLSELYSIYPEREANKGYADLVMEPFLARYEEIKYSYILELKYIPKGEKKPLDKEIEKLVKEAETQLAQYSADKKLAKTLAKTTLIKIVLVFHGQEAVYIGEAVTCPQTGKD